MFAICIFASTKCDCTILHYLLKKYENEEESRSVFFLLFARSSFETRANHYFMKCFNWNLNIISSAH